MNKQLFEYHPLTGYRFIPHLQTRVQHEAGGYLVRANGSGFRSEIEFEPAKTPGKKRVLLFGDSFTAGDGVSNKKRYSDLLMQGLPDTEIYNFGLPGTGTDQQYLVFQEFAPQIEHDLVMIVVLVENIRRVNAKYRFYLNDKGEKIVFQKPFFELDGGGLVLKNTPVAAAQVRHEDLPESEKALVDEGGRFPGIRTLINKVGLKEFAQKMTKYQPLPEYKSPQAKEWLLLKAVLEKWISESQKPVLLVPLPLYQYVEETSDYSDVEQRFAELGKHPNLTVFNPIAALKSYSLDERRAFRFAQDVHPTPAGHQAYAAAFLPVLKTLLHQPS